MKKTSNIPFIIAIFITFTALLLAHFASPFEADDLFYSTNLVTGAPLSSVSDIVEGQIWHYSNWGGRIVAHSILQLTLLSGQTICNLLNTLMTAVLLLVVCKLADTKDISLYVISASLLLGTMISLRSSLIWQSGAANYLYMSVIVFGFLALFFRLEDDKPALPLMAVWMPLLGLLAGWSNENLGPAIWIITLIICVKQIKFKKKLPVWAILSSLTCLLGSIILIAAPGNYVRSSTSPEASIGIIWKLFLRAYHECTGLFHAMIYILFIAAFIFVIGRFVCNIPLGAKRLYLLIGALLSFGALIMSPAYTDRAYWSPTLFLIIFTLSYTKDIKKQREELFLPLLIPFVICWLRGIYLLLEIYAASKGWLL